MKRQYLL